MADLSVIIPGRCEEFHARTVEDVLANTSERTEIIAVLDGQWANPPIPQHARVQVVYVPESIGQRAATNLGAKISTARWIAKLDSHCSVAPGWDESLIRTSEALGPETTIIPSMYNLHAFDWKCEACGDRTYQGPKPTVCEKCKGAGPFEKVIVWEKRGSRLTQFWRLDSELEFGYWGAFKDRPESEGDVVDVMTSIGACFFMERQRFWQLGGLDEAHGSWGFFGAEVALKSWLSGGRHVVSKQTWFSHMFRTRKDFSFPYPLSGNDQQRAKQYGRDLWRANAWPGQVKPLRWLVEQFNPPGWTQEQIDGLPELLRPGLDGCGARDAISAAGGKTASGCVYYTDNQCPDPIATSVREQLARVAPGPIVSVSLKPLDFGQNIVLPLERGILTMFKQILAGLEALDTEYVFLVEHDVLYSAEHFQFTPPRDDTYYYDQAVWKVCAKTGRALHYRCSQTSGLCASRQLLVEHYRKRVAAVEEHGFTRNNGFEPGTRKIRHGGFDDVRADTWMSDVPIIDVRHSANLTKSRWSKAEFLNQKFTAGWTESDAVPGWGKTLGCFPCFLRRLRAPKVGVA